MLKVHSSVRVCIATAAQMASVNTDAYCNTCRKGKSIGLIVSSGATSGRHCCANCLPYKRNATFRKFPDGN